MSQNIKEYKKSISSSANISKIKKNYTSIVILLLFISMSCKKLVEVDPPASSLVSSNIYTDDKSAAAVLTALYHNMYAASTTNLFTLNSLVSGFLADEFVNYSSSTSLYVQCYSNSMTSTNVPLWADLYNYVYICNSALEGLKLSTGVSDRMKNQLTGEAKFMRAFLYFYLTNLWGNAPLILTTNYTVNAIAPNTSRSEIYQQIISDLKDAQNLLSENFVTPNLATTTERVRPTKWAATALLSRVYLYLEDWANAESQSSIVINNTTSFSLENNLNNVFLKNSREAIWQIQPVNPGVNTFEGFIFIGLPTLAPGANPLWPAALSNNLLNSFDSGDNRKSQWIGNKTVSGVTYYYPFKYKLFSSSTLTEYCMVLRIAEQYLIRAEARAQQNNVAGAQSDIDKIRNRGGLPNTIANDKLSLLVAIEHERQAELFTELGHRWLDLKREKGFSDPGKSRADEVMPTITSVKGGLWTSGDKLMPIPLSDIQKNPTLIQNPGY